MMLRQQCHKRQRKQASQMDKISMRITSLCKRAGFVIVGLGLVSGTAQITSPLDISFMSQAYAFGYSENLADLVEERIPAVVNISTTRIVKSPQGRGLQPLERFSDPEELLRKFFGERDGEPRSRRMTSLGSGFIIERNGYIVTNNHVIDGAEEITVITHDDTRYDAEIVGRDSKTDIALLKVETDDDLPVVSWGDSEKARPGESVFAIGNPLNLGSTVTAGIISARKRNINSGPYDDYIQTDASINRGNSGGPLFNSEGKVIGINTAIYAGNGGGNIGIAFAIPTSLAKPVIAQLREYGHTKRGWLGVRIQAVDPDAVEYLGLPDASGALVAQLTPDSPAANAGLKEQDVIVSFNGVKIKSVRQLQRVVADTKVGSKVPVIIVRDGKKRTFQVRLGELEKAEKDRRIETGYNTPESPQENSEKTVLGMTLSALNNVNRDKFDVPESIEGIVVSDVAVDSVADRKGVHIGDVIIRAGDRSSKPLASPDEMNQYVMKLKDEGRKSVFLLIFSRGSQSFKALPILDK